jgi:hypothetical protein
VAGDGPLVSMFARLGLLSHFQDDAAGVHDAPAVLAELYQNLQCRPYVTASSELDCMMNGCRLMSPAVKSYKRTIVFLCCHYPLVMWKARPLTKPFQPLEAAQITQ